MTAGDTGKGWNDMCPRVGHWEVTRQGSKRDVPEIRWLEVVPEKSREVPLTQMRSD